MVFKLPPNFTNASSVNLSLLLRTSASIVQILSQSPHDDQQQESLGNLKTQYDNAYRQMAEDLQWIEQNESDDIAAIIEGVEQPVEQAVEQTEECLQVLKARRDELRKASKKNTANIKKLLDRSRIFQLQLASVLGRMQDGKRL